MTPPSTARRATTTTAVHLVQAGGCAACAQSATALLAPRYRSALTKRGITFTFSPRHADVVLVTGTVTNDSLDALRRYLDGVPQPRALVAVGDCAIDGGVFSGATGLVESPAEALDVNVEIAGCPPSPESILAAITEAAQLLQSDESAVANGEGAAAEDEGDTDTDTDTDIDAESGGEALADAETEERDA
jgi:Ni,Fe-hydrogenase III small subunit